MALTEAQLTTLEDDINTSPELSLIPNNDDGAFKIAELYNQLASPAFIVWRTDISVKDCKRATVWTEYIGRAQGERDAWQFMLSNGILDASDANVRQGIADIFSGPNGVNTRANLLAIAKRSATKAEKLFATGTGTNADPATMTFQGNLSYQEILKARAH